MKKMILVMVCSLALQYSCSTSSVQEETNQTSNPQGGNPQGGDPTVTTDEWSIPVTQVIDGGPGKDGIPALENPDLVEAQNVNYLSDEDLVIGFKNGNDVRAYPHIVLDWHEIINDFIGDVALAVTYCPLTGTGIGWNRFLNGRRTTFGVSGLLYNTNLIPYDRETDSNWSQILNESVNGELIGEKADLIMLVEMDWKTWKTMYPDSKVVSTNTGFSRTYGISPYGDYSTNNAFFLFPVPKDNRLPSKERVLAIMDGDDARAYRFDDLVSENMIRDTFKGKDYLVVGNGKFMVSFELDADRGSLQFDYSFNGSEVILSDNEGNEWNIFGEAISGPRSGQSLKSSASCMAYWFSIPAFYTTEIFGN